MQPGSIRIFIAEDNRADVFLIKEALREHGVAAEIDVAADGEVAQQKILDFATPEGRCPDLFIIDLNLPRVSGHELLPIIRQNLRGRRTSVVVLTSSASPQDERTALAGGADRFIIKPLSYEEFMLIGGTLRSMLAQ